MTALRSSRSAAGILLAALLLSGCSQRAAHEPNANWSLLGPADPQSTRLELGVVRAECAGGQTGEVAATDTEFTEEQVVITIHLEQLQEGAYDCRSNDTVPLTLDLGQPLGQRELIDGACLAAALSGTAACAQGGLRYRP